jgi:hypothetical protein
MGSEDLLLCSQESTTGPYPEPDEYIFCYVTEMAIRLLDDCC